MWLEEDIRLTSAPVASDPRNSTRFNRRSFQIGVVVEPQHQMTWSILRILFSRNWAFQFHPWQRCHRNNFLLLLLALLSHQLYNVSLIINEDGGGGLDSRRDILEINCSHRVGRLEQSMMRNQSFSLGLRLRSVLRKKIATLTSTSI